MVLNCIVVILLSWFLFDGRIRGVTTDGHVFEHLAEDTLVNQFLAGIQSLLDVQPFIHIVQPGKNGDG